MKSPSKLTAEERGEYQRLAQEQYDKKYACPDCSAVMEHVCGLQPGDEEARGSTELRQCPKCKTIKEF